MAEQAPEAGTGSLREAVAEIWRAHLGLEQVRDEDDFFQQGGHSSLAVETALRLRTLTDAELELDILYDHPTFGDLVAALQARGSGAQRTGRRPLTAAEERLWFFEQLHPNTPAYHISVLYRFDARLDVGRLTAALAALTDRHEALRRGFEESGSAFVLRHVPPAVRAVSGAGSSELTIRQLLDSEASRPFDLDRPPLCRALVVEREDAGDLLLLTVHHLICDGESVNLLDAELQRLYAGADASPAAPRGLPLRPEDPQAPAFWRDALAGLRRGPALPYDRDRPRELGVSGLAHRVELPPETVAALERIAGQERLSWFMIWVAAYTLALAAVTRGRDFVIVVPVSSREPAQSAELGMFVDTLPLRFALPRDLTTRRLVRHVRRVVTQALARQMPMQAITDAAGISGKLSRVLFGQTALSFMDESGWRWQAAGLQATREFYPTGTAKYELLWSVTRGPGRTVAELEFNTDLFSAEAGVALHEQMVAAVTTAVADPDAKLPAVTAGTPGERAGYSSVADRVHEQARARPAAVAVLDRGRSLSYRDLNVQAAAVAAGLTESGLRRGDIVAVPMHRGAAAVTAFLGIVRAGCAYLPLDPAQTGERARQIIVQAGARAAIVAAEDDAGLVPASVPALTLGALAGRAVPDGPAPPPAPLMEQDLAYVIFTSGSTGQPKGILVPHGAITRLVPEADYLTIGAHDRVAHLSNPAFDAATFEVWGALTSGATLVVVDREVALSPARLEALIARQRISAMFLTTALFNQVADFAPAAFRSVRALLFGGEMHDIKRLERILASEPPARLVHVYGPTENTTFSTAHDVTVADLAAGVVPIGGPITGTTAYVLAGDGTPVRAGDTGELYLGGAGLALGYLGAPAATAASFVPDPFGRAGGRLYRTGDQVRLLADGTFSFVGRTDDQVKVRGFRVEPGEVELVLRRQDRVRDAVVLGRRTADGTELVAYVSASGPVTAPELRERLAAELPPYLVPSIVLVPALPVNANGKIDRTALLELAGGQPEPGPARPAGPEGDPPSRNDAVLAGVRALWQEVLGCGQIAPGADFFALGGHSLQAMRLIARIDQEFGVELEFVTFIENCTLAGIAFCVRAALHDARIGSSHG
jgi:amino acid adenylation domain-containing protein